MDRFNQALNPYAGLLGEDSDLIKQQGLLGLASGLLAASGPSTTRTSLGQALGQGLQGMQAGQQAGVSNVLKAQQIAGKLPGSGPASVQEWQYYNNLPEKDQKRYLEMKRQMYSVGDVGGVPSLRPSSPGMPVVPLSTLGREVGAAAELEAGKTAARTSAAATTEAQIGLGGAIDDINKMRSNITGLMSDPGFSTIYGASGKLDPRNYLPGTSAANAQAKREQLDAASFGVAIKSMKGMGALSDAEGKKVSAAYTRATNPKITDEEARRAWKEVLDGLDLAEQRALQKAGQAPTATQQQPVRRRKFNPSTGRIE